jgi:RNA polymerase sigma-70 factor (ECF subfamily)
MISLKEIEKAYSDYSMEIFSYILRSVYDHDTAEDILQDVFIKLLNYSLKSSVHGENIRALLYTIARSVCIDHVRKTSRVNYGQEDAAMLPDIHSGVPEDSSSDIVDTVNYLIDSLGEPEKSIILLKRNGLTYSEIAGIMKISERTLKRKVKSVIADLRKKLRSEGFFISSDTEEREGSLNI